MLKTLKRLVLSIGLGVMASPFAFGDAIGPPAGAPILNNPNLQPGTFHVSSATIDNLNTTTIRFNDGTSQSTAGGGGGGGSSTIAVGTGTATNFTNRVTSPTASISFEGSQHRVVALGTTAYIVIDTMSSTGLMVISSMTNYVTQSSATTNFLSQSSAAATYFPLISSTTLLTTSSATLNYLNLSSASATYFNKNSVYVASVNVSGGLGITPNGTSGSAPTINLPAISLSTGVTGSLPAGSISAGTLGPSVIASSASATMLVSSFNVSGINAGSYTNANVTFDAYGHATSASNGSAGGGGTSTLAVGTGTASSFTNNVTSPTAAISFHGNLFRATTNGTTSFITLDTTSANGLLMISSAAGTYLTQSSATATYLQLSSAAATYQYKGNYLTSTAGLGGPVAVGTGSATNFTNIVSTPVNGVSFEGMQFKVTNLTGTTAYILIDTMSSTGLMAISSMTTYMTQSSATLNDLTLSSAAATYQYKGNYITSVAGVGPPIAIGSGTLTNFTNIVSSPAFALSFYGGQTTLTLIGSTVSVVIDTMSSTGVMALSTGTNGAGQLLRLNASTQLPAVDGSLILRVSSLTAVVGAGSCTNCNATFNAQGQVTTFTNGSAGGGSGSSILAVGTGTASSYTNNTSSPTSIISLEGTQFHVLSINTTAYVVIDTMSPTGMMTISSMTNYVTQSSASANYLTLSSATATYFNKLSVYVASVNVSGGLGITANGTSGSAPTINLPAISLSTGVTGTLPDANIGSVSSSKITGNNFASGSTNYINLTASLQSGATFFVSSGTAQQFNVSTITVGSPLALANAPVNVGQNANGPVQINVQNTSNGSLASSDHIVTNDLGSSTSFYADFGINSSSNSDANFSVMKASDSYLYAANRSLDIGTAENVAGSSITFFTGGTSTSNVRMGITNTGTIYINGLSPGIAKIIATSSNVATGLIFSTDVAAGTEGQFYRTSGGATKWDTIKATDVAAGSLGASVIASSIAVNAVQDASIVGVSASKITGNNLPSGSTNYIQNALATPVLQGATYYVSSGTVVNFNAFTALITSTLTTSGAIVNNGIGTITIGTMTALPVNLVITTRTTPSAPSEGQIWTDGDVNGFRGFQGGITGTMPQTLYVSTSLYTYANSTTISTINAVNQGKIGTNTLPANYFKPGKAVEVYGLGIASTTANPTLTMQLLLGTTSMANTTARTMGTTLANVPFNFDLTMTCISTGTAGLFYTEGTVEVSSGAIPSYMQNMFGGNISTATVNTTVTNDVNSTFLWGTANVSNSIRFMYYTIRTW